MNDRTATFRFYEELNDFLPLDRRKRDVAYRFRGTPSVKDAVEAQGPPHVEVDLILVDGVSVGFDHLLRGGERVAVYPIFESLDISPVVRLRERPLRDPRFVCDVHLGVLARRLRLLGFDTLYGNDWDDLRIAETAASERRCVLTRDTGLLKRRLVERGYRVRSTDPERQPAEVVERLQLRRAAEAPGRMFSRCPACNGTVEAVEKADIVDLIEPGTRDAYDAFRQCRDCGRVYWRGTHYRRLQEIVARALASNSRFHSR